MKWLLISALALTGCTTLVSEHATLLVRAGKTVEFFHASELGKDCSVLSIPEIAITTPPAHGRVNITQTKLKPTGFKPNNSRYKCRDRLVTGVVVRYTANPGYAGRDFVRLRVTFHHDTGDVARITHDDFAETFHVQ